MRGRKKVPRRTFNTLPLGPQVQALYRSSQNAERMRHRAKIMAEFEAFLGDGGVPEMCTDTYFSEDFLAAVDAGKINSDDLVLMFSIDGAQLYEHKSSDCWIYIWILFDMSPKHRYKKRYVLP
ncbi:hypothetical protein C8Q76DRAFT_610772, partial [Earliella scabrosa]